MENEIQIPILLLFELIALQCIGQDRFEEYPHLEIANDQVTMKLCLPDPKKGFYRATRFDWSGIISSLKYKGHEYFGYWKDHHDPTFHEDLCGPAESYLAPGLGFEDSTFDGRFIRIGVGILFSETKEPYEWNKTYMIIDHGEWEVENGDDWIQFKHTLKSDFGYGYVYTKKINLKSSEPGFAITHILKNTGEKRIQTDQYNHNFFIMDNEHSGPHISIAFPFDITTEDDLKGKMNINGNQLAFLDSFSSEDYVWLQLNGFSDKPRDHKIIIKNEKTGAGVVIKADKPLSRVVFWAIKNTYCPENSIDIAVESGETEKWVSEYTLFTE